MQPLSAANLPLRALQLSASNLAQRRSRVAGENGSVRRRSNVTRVLPRIPIIDRYVTREILGPLGMSLVIVTFALVVARLLKLVDLVVNQGVGMSEIFSLVGFLLPQLLELTFPMAIMLGVLLGFGRLSGDQLHQPIHRDAEDKPSGVSIAQRLDHLRPLVRIAEEEVQDRHGDDDLQCCGDGLFQRMKDEG